MYGDSGKPIFPLIPLNKSINTTKQCGYLLNCVSPKIMCNLYIYGGSRALNGAIRNFIDEDMRTKFWSSCWLYTCFDSAKGGSKKNFIFKFPVYVHKHLCVARIRDDAERRLQRRAT